MKLSTYINRVEKKTGVKISKLDYNSDTSYSIIIWVDYNEEKDEPNYIYLNTGYHGCVETTIKNYLKQNNIL